MEQKNLLEILDLLKAERINKLIEVVDSIDVDEIKKLMELIKKINQVFKLIT